ncbi:type II toxin-antitoxin system MqsR family toxin [Candidatus Dojkabacteria bacterium]|nr:type II toxin-antitoxin system MqsR family toxin [Candidatus Dojkabacteria bacterium]
MKGKKAVNETDVKKFLDEFKGIVSNDTLYVINRQKNREGLIMIGITKKQRQNEILSITVTDYCAGPELDKDRPGNVWIFGKKIGTKEIYIKLKIAQIGLKKIAKCLSFHVAEYPLCYPLKGGP